MLKATFFLDIGRAPEDVYRLVSNHENDVRWQASVARVVKLSAGPVRAGSRFRHTLQLLGVKIEAEIEIAETRASDFHAFSIVGGPFVFDTCVSLQTSSLGTKVRTEIEGRAGGVTRLAAVTLSRIRRGEIERDLQTLKRLMEAREL